ncbi:Sec-independent protein translocase protein TatB [Microbulbifer sp. YPW1]|uniref:Sec-independent protein translocase protein TatB n=1 Tax=Microbulbifer sp. YPW1 TaxID=2745199 RepID=UPI0015998C1C|nr:Sec-independent protein translocase protein TatB [Microbulbifer sp. YPW1]QKX16821.1 twin-arginine translocase subunit TatB [Microbulbifer sp. YPW1]
MFDIGFFELLLIGIVGLVVIGPERLPDAVRTTVRWWTQLKQTLSSAKDELEREVGADDIRRELHNERVLRELRESQEAMERTFSDAERKFEQDLKAVEAQAQSLKQDAETEGEAAPEKEPPAEPDVAADQRRQAADYLPEEDREARIDERSDEEYLPEEDEDDEDQEDPEYPEHLHDHGDPQYNPHHPDHFKHEEDEAWAEVDRLDPAETKDRAEASAEESSESASPAKSDSAGQVEDKRQ